MTHQHNTSPIWIGVAIAKNFVTTSAKWFDGINVKELTRFFNIANR